MTARDWLFGDTGDTRDERCRRWVERCGCASAALTILPIPGTEVIDVMPIHVGMVVGLAEEHGVVFITHESAADLILKIGATVGLSLLGSRIAMTAGKIILPGVGGLVAAPFIHAFTLAIGAAARAYFEAGGGLDEDEMKRVYERTVRRAKRSFDPSKARSREARDMAERAAEEGSAGAPKASVDDLAERLATLEQLRELGAISEQDYERRKARILDEV